MDFCTNLSSTNQKKAYTAANNTVHDKQAHCKFNLGHTDILATAQDRVRKVIRIYTNFEK